MAIPFKNDRLLKPSKSKISIDRWYGLNYTDTLLNGECAEMKNLSCDGSYVFPRPPREVVAEGIQNPQKLLFCGDKLSYIAGGRLSVKDGDTFSEVGDVGTVTSAVDFNNQEMLFYPSDMVYDYEKGELSEQNDPLSKIGDVVEERISVIREPDIECYGFDITDDNGGDLFITLSPVIDDEGKPEKDKKGNDIYPVISVVCSDASNFKDSNTHAYKRRLFVCAWDKDGKQLSNYNDIANKEYHYQEFEYGEPIAFDGGYAVKLKLFAAYYYSPNGKTYGYRNNDCKKAAQADFNNDNYKFWIVKNEYPAPNSRPNITYACMDNNRVVAVEGNNFYASCLGNYADWTDFVDADGNPKETGAYAEELYTYGDFTGIIKYRNNVIITKKDMLYECYGNKPPYRINLAANVGCIDQRSMVEVNGVLYWLGAGGIYRYAGGLPVNISQKLNTAFGKFESGCGATDGRRYYIYACSEQKNCLLVYDTVTGLWCREDGVEIADMTSFDNVVYAMTTDGTIYKFQSGEEEVVWEFETKAFDLNSAGKKIPRKLTLTVDAAINASLDVYIKYDNGGYKRIASYSSFKKSVVDIRLKNKPCDSFSFKLSGKGNIRIYGMDIDVISSNKQHNKDYLVRY